MSQEQPQPTPSDQPNQPGQPQAAGATAKKRKRRRWPWVIVGLLVILIMLVLLAPMIASTAPVRSIVMGQVNKGLNGEAQVAGWSLSWTGGTEVRGIKVYDDQKRLILDVPRVQLGLGLLDAARQKFHLGGDNVIDVESFVLRVNPDGSTNFDKLLKAEPQPELKKPATRPGAAPAKLPDVTGKLTVNFRGTIEGAALPKPVHVDSSTAVLNIADINKPIDDSLKLAYRVGDADQPSHIEAAGTVDAIENNLVQVDQLAARQKLMLKDVNLAAAGAFLPEMKVGGKANGSLDVSADGGITGISTLGEILVNDLLLAGGPLKQDQFQAGKVTIPVQVTRTVVDKDTTLIKIEKLGVQLPQAAVAVSGQVAEQALLNLADQKPPGHEGQVKVVAAVTDLPDLARQLRSTLQLEKDVAVTGGMIHEELTATLSPRDVAIAQQLKASAEGTQGGKPIRLEPITVNANATAIPTGQELPDVREIKLAVDSAFAKVQGGGPSLGKLDLTGSFDLNKLRSELAQFVDLGSIQLDGTGDFALGTQAEGDITADSTPITASAKLNLQNVKAIGLAKAQIDQDRLALAASGKVLRREGAVSAIDNAKIDLSSGDPNAPLLALAAAATGVDLRDKSMPKVGSFELSKLAISDLAKVQSQYGGLVPALGEQGIKLEAGQVYATVAGAFDGKTVSLSKPLSVSLPGLTVRKDEKPLLTRETIRASLGGTISMAAEGLSANLNDLSLASESGLIKVSKAGAGPLVVNLPKARNPSGNGTLSISADLVKLNNLAQRFGGQVAVQAGQPQLRGGRFEGTVALVKAEKPETSIQLDGAINGLTVFANRRNALENEKIGIKLAAVAPDDLKGAAPITATASIDSSFLTTSVTDARVKLGGGTWDLVQSATVAASVPNLPKLDALRQALAPPAAGAAAIPWHQQYALAQDGAVSGDEPISRPRRRAVQTDAAAAEAPSASEPPNLAPLELTGGSALLKLAVARDSASQTSRIDLTDCTISNLALARGKQTYAFDRARPISLKLAVAVQAANDPAGAKTLAQQVQSIQVSQLSGNLGIATLAMPAPITISDPLGKPVAQGAVKVDGRLDDNARQLLAVLQGGQPLPYECGYSLVQNLKTQGQQITLNGSVLATDFRALDPEDPQRTVFSEDRIEISNDLAVDTDRQVATINSLSLSMPKSQAAGLKLSGAVADWTKQRKLQDVKLDLSYDLEKIWPIIHPMLVTPGQEDQFKDLNIAGKYTKSFTAGGAYPAVDGSGKPLAWNQAVKSLTAAGELTIDLLDTSGLTVKAWNIPISLSKGQVATVYADRPKGQNLARPASCNGGTLNTAEIVVDLGQDQPRLWTARNHKLLTNVTINPLLGDTIGKYVNPVFAKSQRAKGLLNVTIALCQNVALGDKLKTDQSGKARVVFSIDDMDIANPVGSLMFGKVIGAIPGVSSDFDQTQADTFQGRIKDGVVVLEHGVASTDVTFELVDPGRAPDVVGTRTPAAAKPTLMPLSFKGDVQLDSLKQNLAVSLPPRLIGKFVPTDKSLGGNLEQWFPEGIPIVLGGTTLDTQVQVGDIIKKSIEGQLKGGDLFNRILGGDKDKERDAGGRGGGNRRSR